MFLKRMETLGIISQKEFDDADAAAIAGGKLLGRAKEAPFFLEEVRKLWSRRMEQSSSKKAVSRFKQRWICACKKPRKRRWKKRLSEYDLAYASANIKEYPQRSKRTSGRHHASDHDLKLRSENRRSVDRVGRAHGRHPRHGRRRNFGNSQFNRALQAKRQPGSSFKPFTYAAALENNFTASTVIDDYPLVYVDMLSDPTLLAAPTTYAGTMAAILGQSSNDAGDLAKLKKKEQKELFSKFWRPQNFDNKYLAPLRFERLFNDREIGFRSHY